MSTWVIREGATEPIRLQLDTVTAAGVEAVQSLASQTGVTLRLQDEATAAVTSYALTGDYLDVVSPSSAGQLDFIPSQVATGTYRMYVVAVVSGVELQHPSDSEHRLVVRDAF